MEQIRDNDEVAGGTIRVLLVDDHPLVRSGMRSLIQLEDDLDVCGEAEDQETALELIAAEQPDLVLVDISLKNSSGLNLLKEISQNYPGVKTLVVSMHDEQTYAVRCIRAGSRGYVMKQEGTEKIIEAIRRVQSGDKYLSKDMLQVAVEQLSNPSAAGRSPVEILSNRELEVFHYTGLGKEIQEIAEMMSISARTVEVHRSHIKKKLGLRTGTDIFQSAYEWLRESGLLPE